MTVAREVRRPEVDRIQLARKDRRAGGGLGFRFQVSGFRFDASQLTVDQNYLLNCEPET
jgi:hypothetical protein